MAAATHKIESQAVGDGTVQDPHFFEAFHIHLKPDQVTTIVRRHMVRELYYEQNMWSALVVSTCVMFACTVIFVFAERGLVGEMQWGALRPALIAAVVALLFLHMYFRRERKFVNTAPATSAVVIRERVPLNYHDQSSFGVPRLLLRYLPRVGDSFCPAVQHAAAERTLWAALDGFSSSFERAVHAGDLVSILFEPGDPEHVRVVELEHCAAR
jgi:hypothetical protein